MHNVIKKETRIFYDGTRADKRAIIKRAIFKY